MKHKQLATLLALMLLSFQLFAQGRVSGRVYDSKTGSPVEYATVALLILIYSLVNKQQLK